VVSRVFRPSPALVSWTCTLNIKPRWHTDSERRVDVANKLVHRHASSTLHQGRYIKQRGCNCSTQSSLTCRMTVANNLTLCSVDRLHNSKYKVDESIDTEQYGNVMVHNPASTCARRERLHMCCICSVPTEEFPGQARTYIRGRPPSSSSFAYPAAP
jgi:hypothetical protein